MKFVFTYHAQYRMYVRAISTLDIKNIINHPDFIKIQNNGKILKVKSIPKKGKVAVVYKMTGNKFLIITIYYEN